jgi:hypothetical protein
MSMPKTMTEWIRLVATPEDKALLDAITQQAKEPGFSTTVRRLIRQEAERLNIRPEEHREPVTQ